MRNSNEKSPKISIVIPFHNSEKYIEMCLKSVLRSVHVSNEIICVNDGSTDYSPQIVKRFCDRYKNIRLLNFNNQVKLYHARLEGIRQAKGKYIGFVDSDDFVSWKYFDKLYANAVKSGADVSVGTVVNVDIHGVKYIQTRCVDFPYVSDKCDLGKPLYELYWKQCGRCYHWHVLWNKLYKRELWEKALPVFERQNKPLVMLEDFIYSSVVLQNAKSYALSKNSQYFYIAHSEASIQTAEPGKIKGYILDMEAAFNFVRAYLNESDKLKSFVNYLSEWQERYARYWKRNILGFDLSDADKSLCLEKLTAFSSHDIGAVTDYDEWYYKLAKVAK